jgi:hypothetical protein
MGGSFFLSSGEVIMNKDKEYEQKIQAALADLKEVMKKHNCFITFDSTLAAFLISVNIDEKAPEVLLETLGKRWIGMVVSPSATLFTCMSTEMAEQKKNHEKLTLLSRLLDPMEWTQIMIRVQAGEDIPSILSAYEGVITQYEQKIESINNDPIQLLSGLEGFDKEEDKQDEPEDPMNFEGFDDM